MCTKVGPNCQWNSGVKHHRQGGILYELRTWQGESKMVLVRVEATTTTEDYTFRKLGCSLPRVHRQATA